MLNEWAVKWNVPAAAIADLAYQLTATYNGGAIDLVTEGGAQAAVRLEASEKGSRVWRNNVGAMQDVTGRWVRFGLANDSPEVNKVVKSGDLIGIRPLTITPEMIGRKIGQFISREIKKPGWRYAGTDRERAQVNWALFINSFGGDAQFCTGPGSL